MNYNTPLEKSNICKIIVNNIGAHVEVNYDLIYQEDGSMLMKKKGKGLMHEIYLDKYLNVFNEKLNDSVYLNSLCKSLTEQCVIHIQFKSKTYKAVTLILYRNKPELFTLQFNNGENVIHCKLNKSNLELLQLINGLIDI